MQTVYCSKRHTLRMSTALMLLWSMVNYTDQLKPTKNELSPFSNSKTNRIGINPKCNNSYQQIVVPLKIPLNLSH